jgi:hypothetical protein
MKRTLPFTVALLALALAAAPLAANGIPSAGDSSVGSLAFGATPLPGYAEMAALMGDSGTDANSGASVEGDGEYPADSPDGQTGATPGGGKPLNPDFLGIPVSVNAHRVTGYAAGGLLLAGGVIGTVRFLDLMDRSHARRDGGEGGDGEDDECKEIIHEEWADGQALRWTHVGLVASGEALYLFDAASGISMMRRNAKPSLASKIHRNAFFVHAGLMVADVILGILLTNALDKGEHDQVVAYGAAHAGIGVAIPLVIIGSGLAVDLMPRY